MESSGTKSLSEDISQLFFRSGIWYSNLVIPDGFSDKVTIDLHMFCSFMKYMIIGNKYGRLIITMYRNKIINYKVKFLYKTFDSYNFTKW